MNQDPDLQNLLSTDPHHVYTEEELDAIEAIDPALALRLARVQHFASQETTGPRDEVSEIDMALLAQVIDDIRKILAMDGGDIELLGVEERCVRVRMKGACVGCPNAVLDLKNVVEKMLFERVPGVKSVANTF